MHEETFTLFNYRKDDGVWIPTVLKNLYFYVNRSSSKTTQGNQNGDGATIIAYCDRECVFPEGKYVKPKEYQSLSDATGTFTFTPEQDFVFKGEWTDTEDDTDYENGFYDYMNSNFDDVFMIQSAVFYKLIPHFEISGR